MVMGRGPHLPRTVRRDVARIRTAVDDEDWTTAVAAAARILEDPHLPRDAAALIRLTLGRGRFMVGEFAAALDDLQTGLAEVPPDVADLRPYGYWAGMAAQIVGDPDRARGHFEIAASGDPDDDQFPVGAARRALAHLEAEVGNLDDALSILEPMLAGEPVMMTRTIHAVASARAGRLDDARLSLAMVHDDARAHADEAHPTEQVTIGNTLVLAAEVYAELGHADEAEATLHEASRRLELASSIHSASAVMVPVLRAEIARLRGDLDEADRTLAGAVPDPAEPELVGAHRRTAARVLWTRGQRDAAATAYRQAAETFDRLGYRFHVDALRAEADAGPVALTEHPDMLEVLRAVAVDEPIPDSLRLVLPLSDEEFGTPEMSELRDAVQAWEPAVTTAGGEYDGWETGGGEFTVWFYGDPDVLWPVIEADARRLASRQGGGHVEFCRDAIEERFEL